MSLFSSFSSSGYKILRGLDAHFREYAVDSIRMDDALPIMQWRNDQLSALRQNKPLTQEEQLRYFHEVVAPAFNQTQPEQLLLRYTHRSALIGYGGLVHLDWEARRGEVSFLLETERAKDLRSYGMELSIFLQLLKKCAFDVLDLNKIHTESYVHRPWHVQAIEAAGFRREGTLRNHALADGKLVDAVVASCLKDEYLRNIPS